jgi:hypothetical protein
VSQNKWCYSSSNLIFSNKNLIYGKMDGIKNRGVDKIGV